MKTIIRLLCGSLLILGIETKADDISSSVFVERFTITNGLTFRDTGYLLNSGQFLPMFTESLELLHVSASDIAPVEGKPVMPEESYNLEKFALMIPTWVRSRLTFTLLDFPYVIVGIKGKTDPNPPVTINYQPTSQNVVLGHMAFLFCDADPYPYVSYQWRFKGKDLVNATNSTLEIDNVSKANAGIYTCALTTGGAIVLTKPALVRIVLPTTIKKGPKSQTVKAGHPAVFRVAVKGTGPFAYAWFRVGDSNILSTKSIFSIPKVQAGDAGAYYVNVSGATSVTSGNAVLTVE
jgi:hypothetical protein